MVLCLHCIINLKHLNPPPLPQAIPMEKEHFTIIMIIPYFTINLYQNGQLYKKKNNVKIQSITAVDAIWMKSLE